MSDSTNNQALEEFRNAWKQEVQKKQVVEKAQEASSSATEDSVADIIEQTESLTTTSVPVTAMDHYIIAVDNERQGKLGKGIKL